MTLKAGPIGIKYTDDETGAREVAIVSADVFGMAYWLARESSDRIADATSPFDFDAPEDRSDLVVFRLSLDGLSGYCVRADGELVYVFSRVKGRGDYLVQRAIRDGATHLDCFDGYLVDLYGRHGFVEWKREHNWTLGGPDVVWMAKQA